MLIRTNKLHNLPDSWLTARATQWMFSETQGHWWLTAYTGDGHPLYASHPQHYLPGPEERDFAAKVCKYVNKHASFGGAWMAGFLSKDRPQQFYLLWKDKDGDIHIPIEFPQKLRTLMDKWTPDDFLYHADMAINIWNDNRKALELTSSQTEQSLVRGH